MCQQAVQRIQLCTAVASDENTIGVVAVLGSTIDGSDEPVAEMATGVGPAAGAPGWDIPRHVDNTSGAKIARFLDPDLVWDLRLSRVASINTSGHSTV